MFLQRSIQWPSPPAFLSKLLQSPSKLPPNPHATPQKSKRWTLPAIPLPTLPNLRSLLHYTKSNNNTKSSPPSNINAEHFQICINLVHHIFDICILGYLSVFSPVFRITLDVFGVQGAIKLWIHGLAVFLTTTYGMYLLFWLAQEYLFQLASFFAILQALVLMVSLKAEREEKMAREEPVGEEEVEERREVEQEEGMDEVGEREPMEERWAGGSEDEMADSDDMWVSDGEEEEEIA
ncbi:uncharacterized protein C6orf47 homolog [Pelobates fuscus]|uniref:uncharacterized protein C6orf47 homolog n=1 Tax=Pelobates fuscus TaxID=191477 RepID=UPI002FE49DAB